MRILLLALATGLTTPALACDVRASDDSSDPPAELLAFEGDPDYGEYLGSECLTCHRADGDYEGIPGIVGWDDESFKTAMHEYRVNARENPVMQTISARLSDEEIAALSAYFSGLEPE